MTSPPSLPVLRQLLNEATPGLWRVVRWNNTQALPELWAIDEADPKDRGPFGTLAADTPANIAAAVAALNAAPALLDLVERQAAAIKAVQELADEVRERPVAAQFVHANAIREALSSLSRITPLRAAVGAALNPQETGR